MSSLPVLAPVAAPDTAVTATGAVQVLYQFQNQLFFQALLASYLNRVQELESCLWEILNARGIPALLGISSQYAFPAASWAANTPYAKGVRVNNGLYRYACTSAGTSAATGGPSGTGENIQDGTCQWIFVGDTSLLGLPVFDMLGNILGLPRLVLTDAQYAVALQVQSLVLTSGGGINDLEQILTLNGQTGFTIAQSTPPCIVITLATATPVLTTAALLLFQPLARAKPGGVRLIIIYWPQAASANFNFDVNCPDSGFTSTGFADINNPSNPAGLMVGALST